MSHKLLQSVGLALSVLYAAVIIWIYATAPRTFREVATGAQVAAGTYEIDRTKFDAALALFRREQFRAARDEWQLADPAHSDARTQFYIAYAFYREGWGRVYSDDALYKQGLEAVTRSINLAQGGTLNIDDADLQMHSPAELKAELEQGSERTMSDFNPLKVLRTRK